MPIVPPAVRCPLRSACHCQFRRARRCPFRPQPRWAEAAGDGNFKGVSLVCLVCVRDKVDRAFGDFPYGVVVNTESRPGRSAGSSADRSTVPSSKDLRRVYRLVRAVLKLRSATRAPVRRLSKVGRRAVMRRFRGRRRPNRLRRLLG